MGQIAVYLLFAGAGLFSLLQPWIGIAVAYIFSLMIPHVVWFWLFVNIRPVYFALLPSLIGAILKIGSNKVQWATIRNRRVLCLAILWFFIVLSYYFGPYVTVVNEFRFHDVNIYFPIVNKIFFIALLGCLLFDSEIKLKYLSLVLLVSVCYMIYWINDQYLFEGKWGRIAGPKSLKGGSFYADENVFATLFVCGIPFIYYLGLSFAKKIWRYLIWLFIPFGWHAIFLTGSRGALLSLVVTIIVSVIRLKKKAAGLALIGLFVVAFVWQAGDEMKNRSSTIVDFEVERSAAGRLEAWETAFKMMTHNPLIGVGFVSFGQAFPDYSAYRPRQAHNTFFQIAAESGLVAGGAYILITVWSIGGLWRQGRSLRGKGDNENYALLYCLNEAVLVSFIGLTVCSFFLTLDIFEMFYYLFVMTNGILFVVKQEKYVASISKQ